MTSQHKLSLWTAILINLNIMFGTGIFVNTLSLAQLAGFFGYLSYLLAFICILPLTICIAALLQKFTEGGFYSFGTNTLGTGAGFLAAWAYFIGKLASASLLIHVFSSLIQSMIPALSTTNVFIIDIIILLFFIWLNTHNMQTSTFIMYIFLALKVFPILFAIVSCLYLKQHWDIPSNTLLWQGIPATLPLVLFAFAGFEAVCSISSSIKDAHKNGPRAMFISFFLVVAITTLYQFLFFLTVNNQLMLQKNFLGIFPPLLALLPFMPTIKTFLLALLYGALATASLGGAYGILFSNHWNLYTLAVADHIVGKTILTRLNHHNIPIFCVFAEGIICLFYLLITQASIILLQQISVTGLVIALCTSIIGLIKAQRQGISFAASGFMSLAALGSCMLFLVTIVTNFITFGLTPLIIFCLMLMGGFCMYLYKNRVSVF